MADVITQLVISARDETAAAFNAITGNITGFERSISGLLGPIGGVGGAIAGLASTLGAMKFVDAIAGSIEFAASLKDISETTGASVESLSQIAQVAKVAGVPMDAVSASMGKLAKSMTDSVDPTSASAKALKALGVTQAEINATGGDTGKMYIMLAKHMGEYADGAGKTAAAQALLGKSGGEQILVMNAMADAGDVVAKITADQAAAADEYSENLVKLKGTFSGLTTSIAMGVTPVLLDLTEVMLDIATETGGVKKKVGELAADGSIKTWAQGAALGIGFVIDAFDALKRIFDVVGTAIGAGMALLATSVVGAIESWKLALSGNLSGAVDAWASTQAKMKTITGSFVTDIDSIVMKSTFSDRLKAKFGETEKAAEKVKPQLEGIGEATEKADKSAEKYAEQMGKLLQKLDDENAKLAVEVDGITKSKTERALDSIELERQKALREDVNGKIQDEINALFDERKQLVLAKADAETYVAAQAAIKKANDDAEKAIRADIAAIEEQTRKQREANATFGLGATALIDYKIAELAKQAAEAAGTRDGDEVIAGINAKIEKYGELKEEVALGETLKANQKAQDDWAKAWDATINSMIGIAKDFTHDVIDNGWGAAFKNLFAKAKEWFLELVAEMTAKQIVVSLAGAFDLSSLGGLIPGLGGGGSAGGLPGVGGGLGGLGDLGSVIGMFSGLGESLPSIGTALSNIGTIIPTLVESGGNFMAAFAGMGASFSAVLPIVGAFGAAAYFLAGAFDEGPAERYATFVSRANDEIDRGNKLFQSSSALGWFGLVDDMWFSNEEMGEAVGAFMDGIRQVDNAIAAAVGPEVTAQIAQNLEAVATTFSAGIEHEATSFGDIVRDRYTVALNTMQQGLGELVENFEGTDAELAAFVVTVSQAYAMSKTLPAEIGQTLMQLIGAGQITVEEIGRFAAAYTGLHQVLQIDPQQEALKQMASATVSVYGRMLDARAAVVELTTAYDGTVESTEDLYKGTQNYIAAQIAALVEIEKVSKASSDMFSASKTEIEQFFWDNEQRATYLQGQAAKYTELLNNTLDPALIQEYSSLINKDLTEAFRLLSPEEQKKQQAAFVAQLGDADDLVQERLKASRQEISQDNANAQSVLGDIRTAMDGAATRLIEAAGAMEVAAGVISNAAKTSKDAADTANAAAGTQAAAAAAQRAAAAEPIKLSVDGNLAEAVSNIQSGTERAVNDGNYWLLQQISSSAGGG